MSTFSRIRTEYREILSISPYSVWTRKMRARIALNMETFHAVLLLNILPEFYHHSTSSTWILKWVDTTNLCFLTFSSHWPMEESVGDYVTIENEIKSYTFCWIVTFYFPAIFSSLSISWKVIETLLPFCNSEEISWEQEDLRRVLNGL